GADTVATWIRLDFLRWGRDVVRAEVTLGCHPGLPDLSFSRPLLTATLVNAQGSENFSSQACSAPAPLPWSGVGQVIDAMHALAYTRFASLSRRSSGGPRSAGMRSITAALTLDRRARRRGTLARGVAGGARHVARANRDGIPDR